MCLEAFVWPTSSQAPAHVWIDFRGARGLSASALGALARSASDARCSVTLVGPAGVSAWSSLLPALDTFRARDSSVSSPCPVTWVKSSLADLTTVVPTFLLSALRPSFAPARARALEGGGSERGGPALRSPETPHENEDGSCQGLGPEGAEARNAPGPSAPDPQSRCGGSPQAEGRRPPNLRRRNPKEDPSEGSKGSQEIVAYLDWVTSQPYCREAFAQGARLGAAPLLKEAREVAEHGVEACVSGVGQERVKALPHPSLKGHFDEAGEQIWKDAARGRVLLTLEVPELDGVISAPLARVPKRLPDRTLSTKGRLVWDARRVNSYCRKEEHPPALGRAVTYTHDPAVTCTQKFLVTCTHAHA